MSGKNIDLKDPDQVTGAVYFAMGRGTEGGNSSYHLSITGVTNASKATDPGWGDVDNVIAQSGYSLGTVQVDFGQRGTWPLGAIEGRKLQPGEKTYVDAVVDAAAAYAKANNLPFSEDQAQLRKDLLTHGPNLRFIDTDTRDAINQWASSKEGKQWIHQNIDLPQVRNATAQAVDIVEKHRQNIPEDKRFEVVCMLAKTANQLPGKLPTLEKTLADGGDYEQFMDSVNAIKAKRPYFAAGHAGKLAGIYEDNFNKPERGDALERAHKKVMSASYDPSQESSDNDIQDSLKALHRGKRSHSATDDGLLKQGEKGKEIKEVQELLNKHGFHDAKDRPLTEDGDFGPGTRHAVKEFQKAHGLDDDGVVGTKTLEALRKVPEQQSVGESRAANGDRSRDAALPVPITDAGHPDHKLYQSAYAALRNEETRLGIAAGPYTVNLSAALTADAKRDGLSRIDRIEFNDTGKFARAVEIYPHMNEPALNRNTLPQSTEQGIQQSVQTSTEQLAQVSGNVPSREQVPSPMAQPQQEEPRPGMGGR